MDNRYSGCCYCDGTQWLGGWIFGKYPANKHNPEVNFKTEKKITFIYCPNCGRPLTEGAAWEKFEKFQGALDRLAEYEDTGLTPNEIKDLRNELCLLCGKYKNSYIGACNECRWK